MASTIEFHAQEVSATASGDYYQLYLGPPDSDDDNPFHPPGPYVLVQREFEFPGDGGCNFVTETEELCGHFCLKLIEFSRTRLSFDVLGGEVNRVCVSFALESTEFESTRRIVEVIFGLKEPEAADENFDFPPGRQDGDDAL